MKVIVTGGAGYIGKSLCDRLADLDNDVRILDRRAPSFSQSLRHYEYVQNDLSDTGKLAAALQDIEAVYHLAWAFYPGDSRREIEENLLGTLNLLECCKASNVRHFIFASTAVVYGPTGDEPAREKDLCQPHTTTIGGLTYAVTKLTCEHYSLAIRCSRMAVTVMRVHGVFSKDRLAQFSEMIDQAKQGEKIVATANAGGQYVHLDDVVVGMAGILGCENAAGEVFNLAGYRLYKDHEIAEYIASKKSRFSEVEKAYDPGQDLISVSVEKLSAAIGYQPRRTDFLRQFIDDAIAR